MVALRLFLPDSWTGDVSRLKRARVPVEHRTPRSKPEIALAEIDRAMAANMRFGCVLADAGYGLSAPFRQGLTERGLTWAVGIPRHQKVYPVDVKLIWPITKVRGKPRKHHVPDILSIAAEQMLASAKWKTVSWRSGTKGRLKARFAALRVRTADGPPQRIWEKGQQHLPGDEAWLIGEQRASGEKKYYLANLSAATDLRTLAATIKARWICEQAHQQLKGKRRSRPIRKGLAWGLQSVDQRVCKSLAAGMEAATTENYEVRPNDQGRSSSIRDCG